MQKGGVWTVNTKPPDQGKFPGSAAHPCLRDFRQWPTDRSKQAMMGGAPRELALPFAMESPHAHLHRLWD